MKCEWKKVPIKDLCIGIYDGPHATPPKSNSGAVFLGIPNFSNGRLDLSDIRYISEDDLPRWTKRVTPKAHDIVFSYEATLNLYAIIPEGFYGCLGRRMALMRPDESKVDYRFLYYYMFSTEWREEIERHKVNGSTVDRIPLVSFPSFTVNLPDMATQRYIADILSALDEKIEINNKINANLQQQAQAIFKSWFVDFEPWGGEKPSTWIDAPLGTFVEIKRGGSPRPIKDFLADNGLRWLKISDVTSLNSPFVLDIKEHIKKEGLRKTVYLNVGELVLSNSATPGIPKILDVDSCIHDGWLYFPKSQFSKYWLYLFFLYIRKKLVALGNGSVFTNLKTDILKAYMVMKPTEDILAKFDEIVTPMFAAMLNCDRENARLASLRDNLLPKLMNGEIEIDGI